MPGPWLKMIALTIGIAALATPGWASDIAATEQETIAPLNDDEVSTEATSPDSTEVRSSRPRFSAVDAATYDAMKARAHTAPAPQAGALDQPSGPEPRLGVTTSFTGLSEAGWIPPDTIVGKSNARVLEAVNTSLRLTTTVGGQLAKKTLNTFFGTGGSVLFDPKVYYDRNAALNRRFYVVALQQSGTTDATGISRIWLAVSRSSDPINLEPANWCRYVLNGKRNAGTANSSWADYPGLGVGADKVVITANQFKFVNDAFTFAIVRVLNKLVLANNAAGCPVSPVFTFQPSAIINSGAVFTLQPAQHYTSPSSFAGTSNPVYLLNSVFGTSNQYRVWRVRNLAPVSLQGPTILAGGFLNTIQPNAPQDGSGFLLDTGDTRVTQVAGLGNSIAGVHGTGCRFGVAPTVSCVRYVRIGVGQNLITGALTAGFSEQATFGFSAPAGTFIFWPGVALNNAGQAAIPFQRNRNIAGARFLSSLAIRRAGGVNSVPFSITGGTCGQPFDRTGDYTGAQTDPVGGLSFWLAGERATVLGGQCTWQTQIIKLQVP